jgi:NAD(P)H-hydrate repair Nnr-like enzyme with NAD(P)H-hydrate epimerase domain
MLKARPALMKAAAQNVFANSRQQARTINRLEDEGATVHVLNGQGGANTKALNIAAFLAAAGIDAIVPPINDGKAETRDHTSTLITVYNGAADAMPQTFTRIKRAFKEDGVEIVYVDDPAQDADIVVTVGAETVQLKP